MARVQDMDPLPINWRDVGLALSEQLGRAVMPAGRVLRCGNIEFASWEDIGQPGKHVSIATRAHAHAHTRTLAHEGTVINLRMGSDNGDHLPNCCRTLHVCR